MLLHSSECWIPHDQSPSASNFPANKPPAFCWDREVDAQVSTVREGIWVPNWFYKDFHSVLLLLVHLLPNFWMFLKLQSQGSVSVCSRGGSVLWIDWPLGFYTVKLGFSFPRSVKSMIAPLSPLQIPEFYGSHFLSLILYHKLFLFYFIPFLSFCKISERYQNKYSFQSTSTI